MGKYRLYLDESGDFKRDDENRHQNPSLVGGILVKDYELSKEEASALLIRVFGTEDIHATEHKDSAHFLELLQILKEKNAQFVIFENKERANIIDNHLTYLNVLAEGIIKLKLQLTARGEEDLLDVLIATRTVARQEGEQAEQISAESYENLLLEKMHLAIARGRLSPNHLKSLRIDFDKAHKNPHLKLSDVVCNVYLTRSAKQKFTAEQRDTIQSLYEDCYHYSFIETPEERIQDVVLKGHIEEAIFVALTEKSVDMSDFVRNYLSNYGEKELSNYLSQMMYRIDNLIVNRFNYLTAQRILKRAYDELLFEIKKQGLKEDGRFELDILLYQYTVQTHIGDDGVWKSDERFQEALKHTTDLLVRMKYYIKYQNRRAMNFKNYFYHQDAINILDETILHVKDFVDLMQFLEPNHETPIAYEELGKLYGSKGLNLLTDAYQKNGEYDEAIKCFKLGKQQFYYEQDQQRQDIYIASGYMRAGRFEEGLMYLIHQGEAPFDAKMVIKNLKMWIEDGIKHIFYLNIFMFGLNHAKQVQHDIAAWMEEALQQASFKLETYLKECESHSFVTKALISWHYGYYMYQKGAYEKSLAALKLAIQCLESTLDSSIIQIIHLGILATQLRVERATGKAHKQEDRFVKQVAQCIAHLPAAQKAHFIQYFELEELQTQDVEDAQLEKLIRRTWAI